MYTAIDTEQNKILYNHKDYATLCQLIFLEEVDNCIIFPCDDCCQFLKGVVNLPSDSLFDILIDLGHNFNSDDNESWWDERVRLVTEILNKISTKNISINSFYLTAQVNWKESNAPGKGFRYKDNSYIPEAV